jgi:hypothetical protein
MRVEDLKHWYKENERHAASVALVGGFIFDILTLRRADTWWENSWIVLHLTIVAVSILVLTRKSSKWFSYLMQFSFGGLLSAFLILYFRSATLAVSWPFLMVLALAFLANERLKGYHERLIFQISFFYLSLLSFAVYFVPVMLGGIGPVIFIISGLLSLGAMKLFVELLDEVSGGRYTSKSRGLRTAVIAIFLAMNVMYFANIIPPIPLSLKDAGVYHSLERSQIGGYILGKEDKSFLEYFRLWERVRIEEGKPLYAYTSIFSPANFSLSIIHEWQYFDEARRRWTTISRVPLSIAGGRDEGYRTYSAFNIVPGRWRVNVTTERGLVIGRIGFDAVEAQAPLVLETSVR